MIESFLYFSLGVFILVSAVAVVVITIKIAFET